jgi:hypothetical protein
MSKTLILLFAAAAALSACGGGGHDGPAEAPAPPVTVPAPPAVGMVPEAVNGSVATFIGYLLALTGLADDSSEPLDVSSVSPPTTETAEPSPLP